MFMRLFFFKTGSLLGDEVSVGIIIIGLMCFDRVEVRRKLGGF